MPPSPHDQAVAAVERLGRGEYGATGQDEGHPGANAGCVGRSYTLRLERVLVNWPPLRLARMRCERESVGVVCPPGYPHHQPNRWEVRDGTQVYRTGCAPG